MSLLDYPELLDSTKMNPTIGGDEYPESGEESDSGSAGAESQDAAAFIEAARLVRGSQSADRGGNADDILRSEQQQVERLCFEGRFTRILDGEFEDLLLLSNNTSEHEVRRRESDGRVVKRTWAGNYGQIPFVQDVRLQRRMATPSEYLERQALQNIVFESGIWLEGVNISSRPSMILGEPSGRPSFVISQEFVEAANPQQPSPTEEQIAEFLRKYHFKWIPGTYFGWYRREDAVAIVDAKRDNFILSHEGVIPIDLQMAYVDLPEAVGLI